MAVTDRDISSMSQITLLVYPGTPAQRAVYRVCPESSDFAIRRTRAKYGDAAPLAWLLPDGDIVPVIP